MPYRDMSIKKVLAKRPSLESRSACGRRSVKELMDPKTETFEPTKNSKSNLLKSYARDDIICFVYRAIFAGWDVDV